MYVQQISVFLENTPGRLAGFTRLFSDHGLNLISLSITDNASLGILRCIVARPQQALDVLTQAGYTACATDVLVLAASDQPGGLAKVLECLDLAGINVEYLYSFVRNSGGEALLVLRPGNLEGARDALQACGVRCLSTQDVQAL